MAKVHKTYRLDADLVAQVEAWARENGTNQGEAMARLLARGLVDHGARDQVDEPNGSADLVAVLRGNVTDLRAQVATLTAQVESKDEQIRGLMEQAAALTSIAGNAQALQGVAEQRALMAEQHDQEDALDVVDGEASPQEPTGGHGSGEADLEPADVESGPQEPAHEPTRRGLRAWLADVFGI